MVAVAPNLTEPASNMLNSTSSVRTPLTALTRTRSEPVARMRRTASSVAPRSEPRRRLHVMLAEDGGSACRHRRRATRGLSIQLSKFAAWQGCLVISHLTWQVGQATLGRGSAWPAMRPNAKNVTN